MLALEHPPLLLGGDVVRKKRRIDRELGVFPERLRHRISIGGFANVLRVEAGRPQTAGKRIRRIRNGSVATDSHELFVAEETL